MSSADQLLLSIELFDGEVYTHDCPMGEDLDVARSIAVEIVTALNNESACLRLVTVKSAALLLRGHVIDFYDGAWASKGDVWNCDDLFSEAPSCSQK
jgi:hypothetical protein